MLVLQIFFRKLKYFSLDTGLRAMFWLGWCAGLEKLLAPAWLSNPYCLQLGRGAGFIAPQSAASAAPPPHGANTAARTITHNTSVSVGSLVANRPGF